MNKHIKLPRKRKKAYINKKGRGEYIALRILNEVLCEEKSNYKPIFYKIKFIGQTPVIYGRW